MGTAGAETLCLSYDTDANYSTSNNTSAVINFPTAGSTGTLALTSQIPTSLPASDVYAWAKAATKPSYTASEVGALASNSTGFTPSSPRDFANGTLITTDINYAVSGGDAFLLVIFADGYGNGRYLTLANGYIYNNTIINYGVTNMSTRIGSIIAQNVGGKLCFWFTRQGYWQSFGCACYRSSAGDYSTNHVVSVTNSADPNGTKRVDLCTNILNSAFTSEIPSVPTKVSQLTNDSGFITSAPLANYVARSNGSFTSLPQFANDDVPYFLGIEAFTSGGAIKWATKAGVKSALGVPTDTTQLTNNAGFVTAAGALARNGWWVYNSGQNVDNAYVGAEFVYTTHGAPVTGTLLHVAGAGAQSEGYPWQMIVAYGSGNVYIRHKNGDVGTWGAWRRLRYADEAVSWSGGQISASGVAYANSSSEIGWVAGFGSTGYLKLTGGRTSGKTGLLDMVSDTWVLEGANSSSGYNKWLYHGKLATNRFQCGTASVSGGGTISFSPAFAGTPVVTANVVSTGSRTLYISAVSASGFTYNVNGACTLHWMAYYNA